MNIFKHLKLNISTILRQYFRTCTQCEYSFIDFENKGCPRCQHNETHYTFFIYNFKDGIDYTLQRRRK